MTSALWFDLHFPPYLCINYKVQRRRYINTFYIQLLNARIQINYIL